jgi:hypothetical protein
MTMCMCNPPHTPPVHVHMHTCPGGPSHVHPCGMCMHMLHTLHTMVGGNTESACLGPTFEPTRNATEADPASEPGFEVLEEPMDEVDPELDRWVRILADVCGACGLRALDASGDLHEVPRAEDADRARPRASDPCTSHAVARTCPETGRYPGRYRAFALSDLGVGAPIVARPGAAAILQRAWLPGRAHRPAGRREPPTRRAEGHPQLASGHCRRSRAALRGRRRAPCPWVLGNFFSPLLTTTSTKG